MGQSEAAQRSAQLAVELEGASATPERGLPPRAQNWCQHGSQVNKIPPAYSVCVGYSATRARAAAPSGLHSSVLHPSLGCDGEADYEYASYNSPLPTAECCSGVPSPLSHCGSPTYLVPVCATDRNSINATPATAERPLSTLQRPVNHTTPLSTEGAAQQFAPCVQQQKPSLTSSQPQRRRPMTVALGSGPLLLRAGDLVVPVLTMSSSTDWATPKRNRERSQQPQHERAYNDMELPPAAIVSSGHDGAIPRPVAEKQGATNTTEDVLQSIESLLQPELEVLQSQLESQLVAVRFRLSMLGGAANSTPSSTWRRHSMGTPFYSMLGAAIEDNTAINSSVGTVDGSLRERTQLKQPVPRNHVQSTAATPRPSLLSGTSVDRVASGSVATAGGVIEPHTDEAKGKRSMDECSDKMLLGGTAREYAVVLPPSPDQSRRGSATPAGGTPPVGIDSSRSLKLELDLLSQSTRTPTNPAAARGGRGSSSSPVDTRPQTRFGSLVSRRASGLPPPAFVLPPSFESDQDGNVSETTSDSTTLNVPPLVLPPSPPPRSPSSQRATHLTTPPPSTAWDCHARSRLLGEMAPVVPERSRRSQSPCTSDAGLHGAGPRPKERRRTDWKRGGVGDTAAAEAAAHARKLSDVHLARLMNCFDEDERVRGRSRGRQCDPALG